MRAAYADPPYIGQAKKHYSHDPSGLCAEVDHAELIKQLAQYDAWALSASSPSLHQILPMCPPETRIMAWVKPFASFKPGVRVAYCWEPVLVWGVRQKSNRTEPTVRDYVSSVITLQKGTHGAKPLDFCFWLFQVLDLQPHDELHDLFPGSGIVGRAWNIWKSQMTLEEASQ
jgi:hypothetical protein